MKLISRMAVLLPLTVACATEHPTPTAAAPPQSAMAAASAPAVAMKAEEAPAPAPAPQFELAETPADKLGSAPAGFGPKVGDKAPDASLPDIEGKTHSLAKLYAEAPTLLVFYRGGWCPFCNLQLHALTTAKPEFDKRGVHVVAISVDQPSEEAKTQAKHGVPFLMLSDSNLAAHEKYHVVHVPGDKEKQALAGYKIDLAAYSGKDHGKFAVPASILVDRTGVVRFVHVDEDYKTRPSTAQLLAVIDKTLK
jgi:peroxiredoxin